MSELDSISSNGNKHTMRTRIRSYIQAQISNGALKPGDRIVETKLARELNVSQAPVREAILELSVMGLLEERPYSGSYVRRLTAVVVEDIYNTRAFIEEYAAARAAKNFAPEHREQFDRIFGEMEQAAEQDDWSQYVFADIKFHELVVDMSGSKALKQVWQTLRMGDWAYITLSKTDRNLWENIQMHREVYRHIAAKADHTAGAAMFLHIREFTDDLIRHMQREQGDA